LDVVARVTERNLTSIWINSQANFSLCLPELLVWRIGYWEFLFIEPASNHASMIISNNKIFHGFQSPLISKPAFQAFDLRHCRVSKSMGLQGGADGVAAV
jgi:hypothetical protein